MPPLPARLYLVRHGQTESSAQHLYSGRRDVPLTELGRQQAQLAAESLRFASVDGIWSSPLGRAADTAQAVATATGAPLRIDPRLTEVDYGPLEGLDREGARRRFGAAFDAWRQEPTRCPIPGVEPLSVALERAREATSQALASCECPVIVGHQGILRLVLAALGEMELDDYFKVRFAEAEPRQIDSPLIASPSHSHPAAPQ